MKPDIRELCIGSGRVRISSINIEGEQCRSQDPKNIKRIKDIFKVEGCQPESNLVPVLVDEVQFANAKMSRTGMELPDFEFPERSLECLHGLHRLLAAREWGAQYWIVNFFPRGMGKEVVDHIRNEFPNNSNLPSGEIFRKILLCKSDIGSCTQERHWWSLLTRAKRANLERLLRSLELLAGFKNFVDIPGLWPDAKLGALGPLLDLKCDEEILQYLHSILDVWKVIINCLPVGDIDYATVAALQGLAPGISQTDSLKVRALFEGKKEGKYSIFRAVTENEARSLILQNILGLKKIILSFQTLWEDVKYLKPLTKAMRGLVGSSKFSLRQTFRSICTQFGSQAPVLVEVNEGQLEPDDSLAPRFAFETGYRQLWLFAMRHFPELVQTPPRLENRQQKIIIKEPDHRLWFQFADLAHKLQFDSPQIRKLRSNDPDKELVMSFLEKARASEFYEFDREIQAEAIICSLRACNKKSHNVAIPAFTGHSSTPIQRRHGRPFEQDHLRDRHLLFLSNMFGSSAVSPPDVDVDITSFFVKHTFFQSFWGFSASTQQEEAAQSNGSSCPKEIPRTSKAAEGASSTEASGAQQPSNVATCQSNIQDLTALGKRKWDSAAGTYVIHLFSGTEVQDAPVIIKDKEHIKEHVDTFLGGGFRMVDDHVKVVPLEKVAATLEDYHKDKRLHINMCKLDSNTLQYAESHIRPRI